MRKTLTILVLVPCLLVSVAGKKDKKKKKKGDDAPQVGWVAVGESETAKCYHAPDFEALTTNPRGLARAAAISDIIGQWRGERGDGVSITSKYAMDVETVLFGDPKDVEVIAAENTEWCEKRFAGTATDAEWSNWVATLPARLTKGECRGSLLPQEMHDYLNIDAEWHMKQPFCKGDKVVIASSLQDYYQVDKKGPWINTLGDTSKPAKGNLPCTLENCYVGTMVARFRNYDGSIEQIFAAGDGGTIYTVPDHGSLEVMINDDSWNNNVWKVEGGMQHHTGVSYLPH